MVSKVSPFAEKVACCVGDHCTVHFCFGWQKKLAKAGGNDNGENWSKIELFLSFSRIFQKKMDFC